MTAVQRDYVRLLHSPKNVLVIIPIKRGISPGRAKGFFVRKRKSCPVIYKGNSKDSQFSVVSANKQSPFLSKLLSLKETQKLANQTDHYGQEGFITIEEGRLMMEWAESFIELAHLGNRIIPALEKP